MTIAIAIAASPSEEQNATRLQSPLRSILEVRSDMVLHGRPFQPVDELVLLEPLSDAARGIRVGESANRTSVMLREFPLTSGVPDLILSTVDIERLNRRSSSGIRAITSPQEAKAVALCGPTRGATLYQVADALGIGAAQARRVLRGLTSDGVLTAKGDRWMRHPSIAPFATTYALEAKVSDWRAGLAQAHRYSVYADGVGLILGEVSSRIATSAREVALGTGVGLFVRGRWIIRPRVRRLPLERRLLTTERIADALRR